MIGDRSRAWWQQFSTAGVLFALASCSSESIQRQEPLDNDEPGALHGELAVYIADFNDGTSETRYFLRTAPGVEQRLAVQGEMEVAPGKKLKVWGKQRGEFLEVAKYRAVDETSGESIASQAQPLIDAAAKPGRVMCAALVNIDSGTAKTTVAAVKNSFHTGAGSVDAYYRENSFGQVGLAGDSYGPFTFTGFSGCKTSALSKAITPMLNAAAAPAKCDQYAFVFGPGGGCGWEGLAEVGSPDQPATDTWYADSVSCVVAVQEPGHNYGMDHSSSISCGSAPFADNLSSCAHSEYGDVYDTMGDGCYHMNGWQKLYQKWFGGCNGVRTTSSGKFNIYPIESPCNGVQVLQVPFPTNKTRSFQQTTLTSYYLELRTAVGFDAKYGAPSVLVHAGGAPTLPNSKNASGLHTWLIAAGGGGKGAWGLTAGKSFADPAGGLTISVDSVDATHAVVDIAYTAGTGSPVCLDGGNTAFTPPGPTDCNAPPPPPPPMDAGKGGAGGTAGRGGAAGTAGTAGKGGTGGTAGTGGSAGAGGATGGTGGTAGMGGSAGKGGTGGATGGTGGATGGTGGSSGSGGATGGTGGATGGTGGSGGSTGGTGGGPAGSAGNGGGSSGNAGSGAKPTDAPGCGCRITPTPVEGGPMGVVFALGLGGFITARRRSRRQSKR